MDSVQANKLAAVKFLDLVTSHKIDEAYQTYVDVGGTHHNPYFPAGFQALSDAMKEDDAQRPNKQFIVNQVIGEGDLVAVHSHLVVDGNEMTVVHIFRFKNQKVVEMWDIGMALPADSPNTDGAF